MAKLEIEKLGFKGVKKEDKKVFLALSANYGNVGDIAITIAQEKIISDVFPDRKIIEIPMTNAQEYEEDIKNILNDDDIVTIIGGGNLGNVYLFFEEKRRFIINLFKNNKIISFPQSIDFTNNEEGTNELKKSVEVYKNHNNLSVMAREQKSYDIMTEHFENDIYLVPDTVFYLKNKINNNLDIPRKFINICLRNDKEKITSADFSQNLVDLLSKNKYENIIQTDTHIGEVSVKPEERLNILENLLNTFRSSKLIVTDRLHGMILSIIVDTPCIVLDNSNKKISSTYNTWLQNIPNIKFLDVYDENKFLEYVDELSKIEEPKIDLDFDNHFEPLLSAFTAK